MLEITIITLWKLTELLLQAMYNWKMFFNNISCNSYWFDRNNCPHVQSDKRVNKCISLLSKRNMDVM